MPEKTYNKRKYQQKISLTKLSEMISELTIN